MSTYNNAGSNFTLIRGGEINDDGDVQNGYYAFADSDIFSADITTQTASGGSNGVSGGLLELECASSAPASRIINHPGTMSDATVACLTQSMDGDFVARAKLSTIEESSTGDVFYFFGYREDDTNYIGVNGRDAETGVIINSQKWVDGARGTAEQDITDISLPIYFQLTRSGNNFTVAYATSEADLDSESGSYVEMNAMNFALATDGELFLAVEWRNAQGTVKWDDFQIVSGNPGSTELKIHDSGDTKIDAGDGFEIDKGTVTAVTTGTLTVKEDVNDTGTFDAYGTDSAWNTPATSGNYPHDSETGRYWWPYITMSGDEATFTSLTADAFAVPCSSPNVTGTTPTNDSTPTWSWSSTATDPAGTGNFRYQLDSEVGTWNETTDTEYTPGSALSHGVHTLYVQEETDPSGSGVWSESGSFAITVDLVAPAAPDVDGPASPSNDDTPTWTWTAGGGGNGTFRYQLNSEAGSWTETTETEYTPATGLSDSEHTLYVQERDEVGNWSTSGSYAVTVDTTAPSAPVVTGDTPTTDRTPTWSWTPGGGGNGNYRHQLDSEAGSWTETVDTSWTPASDLDVGGHTLYVQERDAAGNWSASGSHEITVEAGAPAAPTDLTLDPASPTNDPRPEFSWTQGTGGDQAGTGNYQVRVDEGSPEDVIGSTSWTPSTDLSHGTHDLEVREEGIYGDYSTWSSLEITIDTVAPAAPTVDATTPTTDDTPTFTITPGGGGNGTFRWRRNGSAWIETTETSITPVSAWPEGDNIIDAQERDAVGNWSVSGSLTIVVDTTPPLSPVVSCETPTNDNTPEFTWTPGGGGNGTYRVQMDSEAGSWTTVETTSYTPGTALDDGSHTLYVQERDEAGNWSASGSATVEIDTTAPNAPTVTGPETPTTDTTPTWEWESGGGGNGNYRYRINGDDWVLTTAESHTPASPLADGVYIFEVQERDAAGNWSESGSHEITVAAGAPAAPTDLALSAVGDGTVTLDITADDESDIITIYYRTVIGTWTAFGTTRTGSGSLTVTGLSNKTAYTFIAQATRASCLSPVSNAVVAVPTDGSDPLHDRLADTLAALITDAGLTDYEGNTFAVDTEFTPLLSESEVRRTIFVLPDNMNPKPMPTATVDEELGVAVIIAEAAENDGQMANRNNILNRITRLVMANPRPVPGVFLNPEPFAPTTIFTVEELRNFRFFTPLSVRYRARTNRS